MYIFINTIGGRDGEVGVWGGEDEGYGSGDEHVSI